MKKRPEIQNFEKEPKREKGLKKISTGRELVRDSNDKDTENVEHEKLSNESQQEKQKIENQKFIQPEIFNNMGIAFAKQKIYQKAEQKLLEAMESTKSEQTKNDENENEMKLNDELSLRTESTLLSISVNLANLYRKQGRTFRAIEILKSVLVKAPLYSECYMNLAV